MRSTNRRWATGCGCGCGLLVIVLGLLAWRGYAFIKEIASQAEEAEAAMTTVQERHGGLADFQPDPAGMLPAERVEAFIRVRELTAAARGETEASLSLLSPGGPEGVEQVPGLLGELLNWGLGVAKVEGATNLIPRAIAFVARRNQALLEAGMGPGEYVYLYSLVYYSWLGKSPADGPAFPLVGDDQDQGGRRSGQDEFDIRERRRELILGKLNEHLRPMLRRQLAALEDGGGVSPRWREELSTEVAAMEADRFRIPWRDGLPESMAATLEPYRRELEASYCAVCNPLEVMPGLAE
jgi:hypothetical protein